MFPLFLELWAKKQRNKQTAERLHQCGFTSMQYTFLRVKYCERRNLKVVTVIPFLKLPENCFSAPLMAKKKNDLNFLSVLHPENAGLL